MMRTFLKLCVLEPELLMAHVKSYSDLMVEGFQLSVTTWKLRIVIYLVALICLFIGLMSASVSILFWAALPLLNDQNSWVLIGLPLILIAASGCLYFLARGIKIEPLFNDVQEQLNLDLLAICQTSVK